MKRLLPLFLGIALFIAGMCLNLRFQDKGITVSATITNIETVNNTDDTPSAYEHTYYGSYTVDGKQYNNKKLMTRNDNSFFPDPSVGDTIELVVSPNNPNREMLDGSILGVIGMLLAGFGIFYMVKQKKQQKTTDPPTAE